MFGKEVAADNVKALLVYAIGATIFTVCLSVYVQVSEYRQYIHFSIFQSTQLRQGS